MQWLNRRRRSESRSSDSPDRPSNSMPETGFQSISKRDRLRYLGSNGLEINAYSSCNHEDYKFFYVKDYLTPNIINDILVLHKSDLLNNK